MNLTIKQSTTLTENSSSPNVVEALYQLTKPDPTTGLPSANAVLVGRIQVPAAYEDAVSFLNTQFSADNSDNGSDFQITVLNNNYYIRFADEEVVRVLVSKGVMEEEGLTVAQAAQTVLGNSESIYNGLFRENTVVETFDEIKYFTKWMKQQGVSTKGLISKATNLVSVDLTNIEKVPQSFCNSNPNLMYYNGINSTPYTLSLPNLVEFIYGSDSAFRENTLLKHIVSLGSVTSIVNQTFQDCTDLEDVVLPSQCITLKKECFRDCTKLHTIKLSQVTTIGDDVFSGCLSLEYCDGPNSTQGELNLPNLTGTLGNNAFKGCTKLTSVASLGGITAIGDAVFKGCTKLTSVASLDGITAIGDSVFEGCTKLETVNLPHVTAIGSQAFKGCSSLEYCGGPNSTQGELNLPYLNTLANRAFYGCSKLTSVTNLGHITEIKYRTFENCTGLATINFPNSVSMIDDNAFEGTAWYNAQPNGAVIINNVLYKVKNSVGSTYTIPDSITVITKEAFQGITDLTEVTFPNNMMVTEGLSMEYAFDGCTALTTVNNLHTALIPQYFCSGCKNLTTITIPSTVTKINTCAFSNCNLLSINIPASVTSIADNSFNGNVNCTSITVDANNTVYDSRDNCNALIHTASNKLIKACKNTVIPNTVTQLSGGAFSGVQLTSIDVAGSIRVIPQSTFSSCHMNSITLNEGLEEVGMYAFQANNFATITFPSTLQLLSVGFGCLDRCSQLQSVIFLGTTAPVINQSWLLYGVPNTCKIYVPDASMSAYEAALSVKNQGLVDRLTPMSQLPTT